MLVLLETAAGYGLFKLRKSKLMKMDEKELMEQFATPEKAQKAVTLQSFESFKSTKKALEESNALIEAQVGPSLRKFLRKEIIKKDASEQLAVADKSLAVAIQKKLKIDVVWGPEINEVIRGVKSQFHELVEGITPKDARAMELSLSHTLNRFKLNFRPDKVDTMVVQAIGLLDDIDRELNNMAMRLKEWYGWHFPELPKIVTDNQLFAKSVKAIGYRSTCSSCKELEELLSDEVLDEVRQAAEISMGVDVTDEDLENIMELSDRVIELTDYRASLAEYLRFRMEAIAPNVTHMVGELLGARLVAHAGSLVNLAKHPSSTVQLIGAEKALFRALKQRSKTPKYGLLYHAALVGQGPPKLKGRISRSLASKLSLCSRVDALGESSDKSIGISCRAYMERRVEHLQRDSVKGESHSLSNPSMKQYVPKKRTSADVKQEERPAKRVAT